MAAMAMRAMYFIGMCFPSFLSGLQGARKQTQPSDGKREVGIDEPERRKPEEKALTKA